MPRDTDDGEAARDDLLVHYAPERPDQPVSAIVDAVSSVKSTDSSELEPLSRVIDTDALCDLFGGRDERAVAGGDLAHADPRVTFEYEGCVLTVTADRISIDGSP